MSVAINLWLLIYPYTSFSLYIDVHLNPQAVTSLETGEILAPFKSLQAALAIPFDNINIWVIGDVNQDLLISQTLVISKNISIRLVKINRILFRLFKKKKK